MTARKRVAVGNRGVWGTGSPVCVFLPLASLQNALQHQLPRCITLYLSFTWFSPSSLLWGGGPFGFPSRETGPLSSYRHLLHSGHCWASLGLPAASLPRACFWFTLIYSLMYISSASTLSGEWMGVQWREGGAGFIKYCVLGSHATHGGSQGQGEITSVCLPIM